MGVTVKAELTCHAFGKAGEDCCVFRSQAVGDPRELVSLVHVREFFGVYSEKFVELGDECLHCRNELDESFGNEHGSEIVAVSCSACYNIGDRVDDVVESLLLGFNFF